MKNIVIILLILFSVLKSQSYYDVYPQESLTIKPVRISEDRLIFTETAAEIGLEGIVSAYVLIDSNGQTIRCDLRRKSHHMFDTVAVNAFRNSQFTPPIYKNKRVRTFTLFYAQYWQSHKRETQYKAIRSKLSLVDSLIQEKQYTKAFRICEELYSEIDSFKKGQKSLAWSYEQKNDKFHSYSADWNSYLFDEELAKTIAYMGKIYLNINRLELSEQHYLTSLNYAPYLDYIYGELGILYYKIKDFKMCIEYCKKAVQLIPNVQFISYQALANLQLLNFEIALNLFIECKRYCNKFDLYFPESVIQDLYKLQKDSNLRLAVDDIFKELSDMLD